MNIKDINSVKNEFQNFKDIYESGDLEKAREMLQELLEAMEEQNVDRRAARVEKNDDIVISKAEKCESDEDAKYSEYIADESINISLNHVMEYYIYAYYFKPEDDVCCTEIPYGEYYRTYGELCISLEKYNAGVDAYKKAIEWNPTDLDSILGLAECYKYLNKLDRYISVTKQAYRYCCTRATMARYYRNMGYYYLTEYKPEIARACYVYSNIYYHTDNADAELAYLEQALNDKTPEYSIKDMQKIFDENGIEPGPESDTIGVVYRVGEIMMKDGDNKLAKDCFSIVYDITQEKALEDLLNEL